MVAVLIVAAGGVYLWLRTYAPLDAAPPITPGAGLGADVEPTFGSGGKRVLIPAYRPGRSFDTTFTVHNGGRFAVTLRGVDPAGGPVAATTLVGPVPVRLDPHDSALVTVRWRLRCGPGTAQASSDRVRLRYRYLSSFTRTQAVVLPFAVTLRCSGGPPPAP